MRRRLVALLAVTGAAALLPPTADAAPSPTGQAHRAERVCTAAHDGVSAACAAWIRTDAPKPGASGVPAGLGPSDIQSAYGLAGLSTTGTVAIVDAYDDPTAESDLGVYRSQYGLPPCTTANGCFKKVNQTGGTKYPRTNAGWAQEISLDLDMVSAACPTCKILLVEASSNSFANLGAAVNYAAAHADAVSNSYGGGDASDANYGQYYNHAGVAITVSSGDNGYGVEYPASSQYVTAVGGTSLVRASNSRGWSETVWSGAGSGCSAYNAKPSWQNVTTGCTKRAVADVAAVADPNTGVAVYDSTPYQGRSGWLVFGGTSASAPIIASVFVLARNWTATEYPAAKPYANPNGFWDVTSGSNGTCPTPSWCIAGPGWDGPTGLGTPNGITGF